MKKWFIRAVTCDPVEVQKRLKRIQLLESPIPTPTPTTTTTPTPTTSQKASSGDISGTKRGIIDPLVSKNLTKKTVKGPNWSKMVKMA